jgi:hypothetical protein
MNNTVVPVLRKDIHGYVWKDEGFPDEQMSYRIEIDTPLADRCRIRVARRMLNGNPKIVELNDISTKPEVLLQAIKDILLIHARPEADPDWLYVLIENASLRRGVNIDTGDGIKPLIPALSPTEIEKMVDQVTLQNTEMVESRKKSRLVAGLVLFLLTACLLCWKFAKNF